jgi:hypothetical protein
VLDRVFPMKPGAGAGDEGGPLLVARAMQGGGRHDNPQRYGALYASRTAESAVAERIQPFLGQVLTDADLVRADGRRYALAALDDSTLTNVIDLDDPAELVGRSLRPSSVATHDRALTQPIALRLYDEGTPGFGWWSTLEASWSNVTLFAERVAGALTVDGAPQPLSTRHTALRAAAEALGIQVA